MFASSAHHGPNGIFCAGYRTFKKIKTNFAAFGNSAKASGDFAATK
jgi:hypothetical protein